ncbi:MAG: winged helix-turn-helix transcriptional regulator [Elusimicrobiota bacterium]|nr:winged helix-turn-helix transcriptional regulator [Elusimicrobiota bacterium]
MRKKIKKPLKKTDKRIFNFVRKSLENRKIPPTVREIAKYLGLSTRTVTSHLKKLRESGMIKFRIGKKRRVSRGLKITTNVLLHRR